MKRKGGTARDRLKEAWSEIATRRTELDTRQHWSDERGIIQSASPEHSVGSFCLCCRNCLYRTGERRRISVLLRFKR